MESNAPDPVMYIPDDDPAVFVFEDGDMLTPLLVADADDRDSAQDAV